MASTKLLKQVFLKLDGTFTIYSQQVSATLQ